MAGGDPRDLPGSSPAGAAPGRVTGGLGCWELLRGAEGTLPPELQGLEKAHFLMEAENIPIPQDPKERLLAEAVGSWAGTGGVWAPTRDAGTCRGIPVATSAGTSSAGFQGHLHREMVADGQSLSAGGKTERWLSSSGPTTTLVASWDPNAPLQPPNLHQTPKCSSWGVASVQGLGSGHPRVHPGQQGAHPCSREVWWVGSLCRWARVPQPLTHILALEVESLLEVVDGGRARLDVLAQRSAAGDDAARVSWGC